MTEQWKNIEGYEDYQVSTLGNVKHGVKHLKPFPTGERGDLTVSLTHNRKRKNFRVARLVALAFIPNPLNLPEVNHKGTSILDNRVFQLEWRSKAGQEWDKVHRGLHGEDGVYFAKHRRKWTARYSPEPNKETHLGYFLTYEDALEARQKAVLSIPFIL
jgi:hypothetical protein